MYVDIKSSEKLQSGKGKVAVLVRPAKLLILVGPF